MTNAAFTIENLPEDGAVAQRYLTLVGWAQAELEAIAAGMHNQALEARALSNAMWSEQMAALMDITMAALEAGVDMDAIMAVTHREYRVAR